MPARIGLKNTRPVRTYFKEWREWKGWTQQELADRMETTKQTVSRVESGKRPWSKDYLESFSYVIGCPRPEDPITCPPGTPRTLDDMLRDAPPEVRQEVIEFVRFKMAKFG